MQIENYATERFANGPVGSWCTTDSSPFGQFAIDFQPDGTGEIEYSAMESLEEGPKLVQHDFQWKSIGKCEIEIECKISDTDFDHRIIKYEFKIESDNYGMNELLLTEPELSEMPNTLFYFYPPCLAWVPPASIDDDLETMLESSDDSGNAR